MSRRGFTLLEVLLTITITAIMMGIIYGVLVSTLQARTHLEKTTEVEEAGPVLLKMISDDIAAAFVPPVPDQPPPAEGEPAPANPAYFLGKDETGAGGDADALDFVSSRDIWDPDTQRVADFAEIGLSLKANDAYPGLSLLVRREDPFIDDKPQGDGILQEMYPRVKSLNLEYWDGEEWQTKWGTEEGQKKVLPRIVRITLVLVPDEEKAKKNDPTGEKKYTMEVSPVR